MGRHAARLIAERGATIIAASDRGAVWNPDGLRDTTAELLDRIRPGTLTPRAVADQMAVDRLREALALRRRF